MHHVRTGIRVPQLNKIVEAFKWNHLVEEAGINESNKNNMTSWCQMLLHVVKGLDFLIFQGLNKTFSHAP